MTDIELLPSSVAAFVEALKGERGSLDAWLEVNNEREVAAHVEAYARAVAEHNVNRERERAERLAEALREIAEYEGHPRTPIYSSVKKSAIARAALRDHDQENSRE